MKKDNILKFWKYTNTKHKPRKLFTNKTKNSQLRIFDFQTMKQ